MLAAGQPLCHSPYPAPNSVSPPALLLIRASPSTRPLPLVYWPPIFLIPRYTPGAAPTPNGSTADHTSVLQPSAPGGQIMDINLFHKLPPPHSLGGRAHGVAPIWLLLPDLDRFPTPTPAAPVSELWKPPFHQCKQQQAFYLWY